MRLPRNRRGKTPIDVTITNQDAGPRVRLTVGHDGGSKTNSDLTFRETEDLVTLLQYKLAQAKGDIPIGDE